MTMNSLKFSDFNFMVDQIWIIDFFWGFAELDVEEKYYEFYKRIELVGLVSK